VKFAKIWATFLHMLCIAFTFFVSADILFIFSSLLFGIVCDFDNLFTYKELCTVHLQKYTVAGFHFSCLLFLVLFRFFALSLLFLQGFILIAIVGTCLCLAVFQPMPNGDSSAINEFLVSSFIIFLHT
jgi:hypothetical protein